jgi:hypothetical protein
MTKIELELEYQFRKTEREALLTDGGQPTLSQMVIAEIEASEICEQLKHDHPRTPETPGR